jgi:hypothetical protein
MNVAVEMERAILAGKPYPPDGVPDTLANRALWAEIAQSMDDLEARGIIPEIPAEHADWPD